MLKIIILFLSFISNILIAIKILKRNYKNNNKSNIYFATMCLLAGFWTVLIIFLLLTQNNNLSILLNRFIYLITLLIIVFFFLFSIEFPYKIFKKIKLLNYILTIFGILIVYIIFSPYFIVGHYYYSQRLYQIENKPLNLIYGIYFIILLICSLFILIKKYTLADGINKKILKNILIATIFPYILGIIFGWYLPHIGMHYLHWLGAVSALLMNILIANLIFKRE